MTRCAEATEEVVDCLVRADADEEVGGCKGLCCVGVGIAEVAEELFELELVATGHTSPSVFVQLEG
jgi:hypothetical protein